jgi:branched-chain amino acid transport system permease protein
VGAAQSGTVLLAAYIGGIGNFIGPVIGAVLVTYLQVMLSDVTEIWQLYFGLMFIAVVMFAPGGLAGLLMMHAPLTRARTLHRLAAPYALLSGAAAIAAVGLILLIELTYRLMAKAAEGSAMRMFGVSFDAASAAPWIVTAVLVVGGALLVRLVWPLVTRAWSDATVAARAGGPP